MTDNRFIEVLLERGALTKDSLNKAKEESASRGLPLEDVLLARGVPEIEILEAKGAASGVPTRVMEKKRVAFDILKLIPEDSARHYRFVPLGVVEGMLEIGMLDPWDITAREALNFIASKIKMPFKIFLIAHSDFNTILGEYKGLGGEVTKALGELETVLAEAEKAIQQTSGVKKEAGYVEETPVTKMVAVMLKHAVEGHASDIHIEPQRNHLRARFRVDGILHTSLMLPLKVHEAIVSRIKILTNMQLDEKRKPQDGRFSAMIEDREVDFRVSTFPTNFGEKVVIRILDTQQGVKTLEEVGLQGRSLEATIRGLQRPYGLILITGPTGSGKSTTLYAMMSILNKEKVNIVSLEDPIEYNIEGVNQSQVKPEIDYDFANGLRSIMRQDPDVIMVGEIRDKETAQLAIHAALTGHLVLSTLHTNSAAAVIPRLVDMGADPYLLAPTLVLSIGQRLVRSLCPESRREVPVDENLRKNLEREMTDIPEIIKKDAVIPDKIYQAQPSAQCPKGTRGRMGVFEVMEMTPELSALLTKMPTEFDIVKEARKQGMITMREDGIIKVLQGKVGMEELAESV
ncbi:MAG: Flp pilus assembly complex ATPase component TadA [Candidatus Niyogibacteria bacterium]|nr:Flp pilus assembly complex ATPase component TadA [Candidatus Niyogibacteria bacterium]